MMKEKECRRHRRHRAGIDALFSHGMESGLMMELVSRFQGRWHEDRNPSKVVEFTVDGQFLVYSGKLPFSIQHDNDIESLQIDGTSGQKQYLRKEPSANGGIAGVWNNDVEEIYFRSGPLSYSWINRMNPLQPEIGKYEVSGSREYGQIELCDVRSIFRVNDRDIVFTPPWGEADAGTFVFDHHDSLLSLHLASGSKTFQRIVSEF